MAAGPLQIGHPSRILTIISVVLSFIIAIIVAIVPIATMFVEPADLPGLIRNLSKAAAVLETLIIILGMLGLMLGASVPKAPAETRAAIYNDLWFVAALLLGLGAMTLPWVYLATVLAFSTGAIGFAIGTLVTAVCLLDKEVAAEVLPYWRAFVIMAVFFIIVFIITPWAWGGMLRAGYPARALG